MGEKYKNYWSILDTKIISFLW